MHSTVTRRKRTPIVAEHSEDFFFQVMVNLRTQRLMNIVRKISFLTVLLTNWFKYHSQQLLDDKVLSGSPFSELLEKQTDGAYMPSMPISFSSNRPILEGLNSFGSLELFYFWELCRRQLHHRRRQSQSLVLKAFLEGSIKSKLSCPVSDWFL